MELGKIEGETESEPVSQDINKSLQKITFGLLIQFFFSRSFKAFAIPTKTFFTIQNSVLQNQFVLSCLWHIIYDF